MMRLRTPNGIVSSDLMRVYADSVEPYGPEIGVVDITTRQNIQLRGVTLEDGADITLKVHALNQVGAPCEQLQTQSTSCTTPSDFNHGVPNALS